MPRRILIYEGIREESLHVCTHVDVRTVFKGVYIYFWLFHQRVQLETVSETDLVSCLSCPNLEYDLGRTGHYSLSWRLKHMSGSLIDNLTLLNWVRLPKFYQHLKGKSFEIRGTEYGHV
jgi:hypothetical protein